ncbi:MAG: transcriptional coactivator p15/PC4 family protein [Syntrophorhabdales bacterium]|jgi:hypothetical protein
MTQIAEVQKNAKERIKIYITEYRGRRFVDCRVYFEDDDGEWKPTKKGIALSDGVIDEVIQGLRKASRRLEGSNFEVEEEQGNEHEENSDEDTDGHTSEMALPY